MLKKEIPELILFFDLEWIPDAAGAIRLFNLPPQTTELEAMQRLWENEKDYSEENPRPFIKYLFSKVVSIAFLSRKIIYLDGIRQIEFSLNSLPKLPLESNEIDEAHLIQRFLYILGEREPQIVGYNSVESDLRVLIQRGMVNEVTAPAFNHRPSERWSKERDYYNNWDEWHLDLLKHFSGWAMKPTLNEISKMCGFPGKLDIDGQHVPDLWLASDLKSIVEYNQIDTLNTYLVWLRFVYFAGKLSESEYTDEQDEFRVFLDQEAEKPTGEHIAKFLEKWDS